jgi:hypothetical protein
MPTRLVVAVVGDGRQAHFRSRGIGGILDERRQQRRGIRRPAERQIEVRELQHRRGIAGVGHRLQERLGHLRTLGSDVERGDGPIGQRVLRVDADGVLVCRLGGDDVAVGPVEVGKHQPGGD